MNKVIRYAGIGSRSTPIDIRPQVTRLAASMASNLGAVLLSGGAEGADMAFEAGAPAAQREIYLPWNGFNGHYSNADISYIVASELDTWDKAVGLAKKFHPAPGALSAPALKLMARNSYQVLGRDLISPVDMVICWTQDGANGSKARPVTRDTGGTGQAIRIACAFDIPVYNLASVADVEELKQLLVALKEGLK